MCLEGDLTRLAQVLANLLNNATKYTDEGGHVGLEAETCSGEVIIRVWDTGVGMLASLLPHVFDLFTQAERTLATHGHKLIRQVGLGAPTTERWALVGTGGRAVTRHHGGPAVCEPAPHTI